MLSALALATVMYTVKPGDTLSGIAQNYNTTWQAIYDGNQATLHNPNLVYAGQQLRVPEGDHTTGGVPAQAAAPQAASSGNSTQSAPVRSYQVTPAPASTTTRSTPASSSTGTGSLPAQTASTGASTAGASYSSGSLSDIPGVPQSFAACVAYRESTNDTNPAANGNAYGIIPASGYNVGGASLAQQKQVFKQIYDTTGPGAWAADGCNS